MPKLNSILDGQQGRGLGICDFGSARGGEDKHSTGQRIRASKMELATYAGLGE